MEYLRLRQVCLVASDLEKAVNLLCGVLGAVVCFRDPAVERFGVTNALIRVGCSFIEIVSPMRSGTAATRYLRRRAGDGGYMVILDSDGLGRWRPSVGKAGVRIALDYEHGNFAGLQLHPKDTGGALLEINHTVGGEKIEGAYGPAGPNWQSFASASGASAVAGAVLQSSDYECLAKRWGAILGRPIERGDDQYVLRLDYGYLRFVPVMDSRGEGLAGLDLYVDDVDSVNMSANELGCTSNAGYVCIGGVRFFWIRDR